MGKRSGKPKTPEQIAADRALERMRNLQAVGVSPSVAFLATGEAIEVVREGDEREGKRVDRDLARRMDAFTALKKEMETGAYDAAMRLERDITIRRGEHDHGRPIQRVDGDIQSAYCRNDQIIAAGERVDQVLAKIGDRDGWLLTELIAPSTPCALRCTTWRDVVAYVTGETHAMAQGAVVRQACVNLRDAYDRLPRGKAEAAA